MHFRRLASLVLLAGVCLSPLSVFAATPTLPLVLPHPSVAVSSAQPAGLTSCSDYYRFGSVYATLSSSLSTVSSGASIAFAGTVTNDNSYPVTDVSVYAKVMENRSASKDVQGPDVVAFIPVASHITLAASSSVPLSYTWAVPSDTPSGAYRFVTYVVASDRFNFSGLSFTDDVTGNSTGFSVTGQQPGSVRFDKDEVTVNGQQFRFSAYPPNVPHAAPSIPVTATVKNTTSMPYDGQVTWKLYSWDGLRSTELLDTKTEELKVQPNASTTISYTAPLGTPASVYYVTGEFKTAQGATSFINIRFVEDGVNIPRLNDVGVSNGTVFACIHSMGSAAADSSKVVLTAHRTGILGSFLSLIGLGMLAAASYSGSIPGDIYALSAPLKNAPSSYDVTAILYQGGKQLDSVTVPYGSESVMAWVILTIVGVVIVLLLTLLLIKWRNRKVSPAVPMNPPAPPRHL